MKRLMAMVFSMLLVISIGNVWVLAGNEKVTLYISGPQQMIETLENKFEEKHGDVLNVFATGCGPLKQKVWTEMLTGNIQADIIWGAEPILYESLKAQGMLRQYKSQRVKILNKEYQFGNGYYTPVNARYGVIVYNENKVPQNDVPRTWTDLSQKCWDKHLVMADASQSAMALALAAGLYDLSGGNWNLLKKYNENNLVLTKTNEDAVAKVESGESWAGIVPHDGVLRLIKSARKKGVNCSLKIVWPTEGAISVQRPIAIIKKKNSANKTQLLQSFVDFSLSEQAQKIASQYGFITVCKGLPLPEGVPEIVKFNTLNWTYLSKHEEKLLNGYTRILSAK